MGVIYLLRHGQASFGSHNYDQLSALGHRQSRVLGQALLARGVRPDRVVSGSMHRHRQTAAGALEAMGASPSVLEHTGVNEFDHENVIAVAEPRYADKAVMMADMAAAADPRRTFQQFFQDAVARWVTGHHDAEYTEPWSVFKLRCVGALGELVHHTPAKGSTLVFTSGGTISVICAHLLGLNDQQAFGINWTLANAGITKIVVGREGLHLVSLNEHAHLEGGDTSLLTYR